MYIRSPGLSRVNRRQLRSALHSSFLILNSELKKILVLLEDGIGGVLKGQNPDERKQS